MKFAHLSIDKVENSYKIKNQKNANTRSNIMKRIVKIFVYTYLAVFALMAIYPMLWALLESFNKPTFIKDAKAIPIPEIWTTENYGNIFSDYQIKKDIWVWIENSFIYATAISTLNVFLNFLAGYALARLQFKGKNQLLWYFLASILVPSLATQIPVFAIYSTLGLFNRNLPKTFWFLAIIFKGMANIILTLQIRQFYLTQKTDIEEAAKVSGLSRFKTFYKISIRQMLPLFAIQWTMVFMGAWNDFLTFQLFSLGTSSKYSITAGIMSMMSSTSITAYGMTLAFSVISFVPMLLIYAITVKIQQRGMKGAYK